MEPATHAFPCDSENPKRTESSKRPGLLPPSQAYITCSASSLRPQSFPEARFRHSYHNYPLLSCQPPFLHPTSPLLKLHSPSSFIPSFSPFIIPLHYFGISPTSEVGYYLSTKIEYLPYFQQVRSTPYIA